MKCLPAAAALAALLVAAPTGSAFATSADPSDGGMWYYTGTLMDELHQRSTGEGVTIAVLDDPVNPSAPDLAGTSLQVKQPSYCAVETAGAPVPAPVEGELTRHGTQIAALLLGTGQGTDGGNGVRGIAPGATVISYTIRSVSDSVQCLNPSGYASGDQAFRDAIADGADIINVSGGLTNLGWDAYAEAIRAGVVVVGAAGNDGGQILVPPAVFNGSVAVGTIAPDMTLDPGSPTGPALGVIAPGAEIRCMDPTFTSYGRCTGSSDAAAYTSGVLALAMSAFPEATGNQILQALIHSTNGEVVDTPVRDDQVGFGSVNARALLETDPTSYPDVNPFIRDDPAAEPAASELTAQAATPSPTTGTTADGSTSPDGEVESDEASSVDSSGFPVAALGLAGVIVVGIVVAVVVTRRRRTAADPHRTAQNGGHHG